jgi:hypothetical protein
MSYRRLGPRQGPASDADGALGQRVADPARPDQQDVRADDDDEHERHEHDVPHEHLAEVHRVPDRPRADRVERVLSVGRDPLRVKVLLGQVAGERRHDRGQERDHAGNPRHRAAAAPGSHPELAPQVNDEKGHE